MGSLADLAQGFSASYPTVQMYEKETLTSKLSDDYAQLHETNKTNHIIRHLSELPGFCSGMR
jgi:hypothetical protein